MHLREKTLRSFQLTPYKRFVQNRLGPIVADLGLSPCLQLPTHRLIASLNLVNAYCKRVDQIEALGVLGQNRGERTSGNVSTFETRCEGPPLGDCELSNLKAIIPLVSPLFGWSLWSPVN
jgi:hypothetical protein